ncbi:hypothetical protein INS49_011862 [Diaporthe citri]|uniref:uncharacterized protein n=1 Tax=Diaporthe citri TaxID=83186 RepID=UPI001C7F924C|nr:uncharacterized protein INS49_011862 [Diaporthe citri]KAG6360795.1 hypothetical protein INS49_011862 [Diaporthe citri]
MDEAETRRRVLTFRNLQRDMATLFGDYRQGIRRVYPDVVMQRVAAEMNADPNDLLAERNRPVRRGWPWNQLASRGNQEMVTLQAQNWKRFWRKRLQAQNVDEDIPLQVGAGRVRRLLRSKGLDARLVKVLGSGGQGMVSLWEINNRREWKRVVIKSTALEGGVLEREKGTTLTVKRAKHTVQLLRFNGDIMVPKDDGSDETEDIESWQQLDDSLEIMCIEYMKNGDMFRFLARIGRVGTIIPNQVLWKIFICHSTRSLTVSAVVKACIAMAHPPRHAKDANTGEDRNTSWGTRLRGKTPYLLPIAGNYGWHSNVWHIGVCMHMLITHSAWTDPPQAIGPLNDHNAMAELFPTPFRVTDFDGQSVDPFYTYGIWLTNPTALEAPIDTALMMILVRCLAADPADRPSLRELLRYARWRQTQPDFREGQDEIRAWSDENISQPPIPSPEAPASTRTGLAALGTDVMDRLTEAAGMLRIGGLANQADRAEEPQLRRVAPVENLRQEHQEQEAAAPPERPRPAPSNWWWNNVISDRIAQLQNVIYARVVPLPPNPPPPPLHRVPGVDDLRARFQQDAQRQPQPPQNLGQGGRADEPRGQNNDQSQPPRGILRNNRPARDVRVRFAEGVPSPSRRGLRPL